MTSTTQHTPGPWVIDRNTIYNPETKRAIYASGEVAIKERDAIGQANARLIAAAPELLEALKALSGLEVKGHALIDRLQFSETGRTLAKKIVEAIAKAEGK